MNKDKVVWDRVDAKNALIKELRFKFKQGLFAVKWVDLLDRVEEMGLDKTFLNNFVYSLLNLGALRIASGDAKTGYTVTYEITDKIMGVFVDERARLKLDVDSVAEERAGDVFKLALEFIGAVRQGDKRFVSEVCPVLGVLLKHRLAVLKDGKLVVG